MKERKKERKSWEIRGAFYVFEGKNTCLDKQTNKQTNRQTLVTEPPHTELTKKYVTAPSRDVIKIFN